MVEVQAAASEEDAEKEENQEDERVIGEKRRRFVFRQLNLRRARVNEILIDRLFVQSLIQWPRGHVDI